MDMIIIMASHMFHNRQNQLENTFLPITAVLKKKCSNLLTCSPKANETIKNR